MGCKFEKMFIESEKHIDLPFSTHQDYFSGQGVIIDDYEADDGWVEQTETLVWLIDLISES